MRVSYLCFLDKLGSKVPFTACEVGVGHGINAFEMLDKTPTLKKLYLVDNFSPNNPHFSKPDGSPFTQEEADAFATMLKWNLKSYGDRAEFIHKSSVEGSRDFPDECLDYVYIDATHTYENVMEDLTAWYPKVKKFGMLAGHDSTHFGVLNAVVRFSSIRRLNHFYVIALPYQLYPVSIQRYVDWWIIKLK